MTLHEAMEQILIEAKRPLSISALSIKINASGLYIRNDNQKVDSSQIRARLRKYSSRFQNINGQVFLSRDDHWGQLLRNYWHLAEILRGIVSTSDFQLFIAVLFFYKRILDKRNSKDPSKLRSLNFIIPVRLLQDLEELSKDLQLDFNVILEFSRLFMQLAISKQEQILSILSEIETYSYDDESFGNIFEYFLNLNALDSFKSPIIYTPDSLSELMVQLLDAKKGKAVYDPACGIGSLLAKVLHYTKDDKKAKGAEINVKIAQLSYMNLRMHGFMNTLIEPNDCFLELDNEKKYDYIISDFPINGVFKRESLERPFFKYNIHPPRTLRGTGPFILFVLSKLSSTGKAVITVSESFLFRKGIEKEIREILVREDVIESIISLPHGALRPNTDAKASIIVLNRSKTRILSKKIKFINAASMGGDSKSIDLNIEEIISAHENNELKTKHNSHIVDQVDLLPEFNLSADAYDAEYLLKQEMSIHGKSRLLRDLVHFTNGIVIDKSDITEDGEVVVVKIEHLSKDILDIYLQDISKSNSVVMSSKYARSEIHEDSLLIARIGENVRPTFYKSSKKQPAILIQNGVYALTPKSGSDKIDLEYLYYQFHTQFVQDQIKKRRLGSIAPYVSISGLSQIVIPYVDIRLQKEFVASQKATVIAAKRAEIEEKINALGYEEQLQQTESDIVRTLVHQLRPTLSNIDMQVNSIKRIISKHKLNTYQEFDDTELLIGDPDLKDIIKIPANPSLEEIVKKLSNDTLQLNDQLTIVNKVMSFKLDAEDMHPIDLLSFMEEYVHLKRALIADKYQLEIRGEHFKIMMNEPAMTDLIDQLLLNAEKHAFSSTIEPTKNKVQFTVKQSKERRIAIIEYQNNGKPFRLSQNDYIAPFHKSQSSDGSGIGGNYIYRIIKSHKGDLRIKEGAKSGFLMTLEIPLTQLNDNE